MPITLDPSAPSATPAKTKTLYYVVFSNGVAQCLGEGSGYFQGENFDRYIFEKKNGGSIILTMRNVFSIETRIVAAKEDPADDPTKVVPFPDEKRR